MPDPEPIHEHALDNLRFIRTAMERAGSFTSIPGWGGFWIGLTATLTAALAQSASRNNRKAWLATWLTEAVVASFIGAVTMWRKSRHAEHSFQPAAARRFFVSYFAPIVSAALLTLVAVRHGYYALLPAVWLLLYGTSFISSGAFSIRVIPVMGAAFLMIGIVACAVSLPLGNILLGLGFGGLHIVFGLIIARSYGG